MGENKENTSNPVDDRETSETEGRDDRPAVQRSEEGQGLSGVTAPADDEIIIK